MVIYLSFLYLLFGIIFLFVPLLYIELSRPRDLIKSGLNLTIGMILLLKHNFFDSLYSSVLIVITILFFLYLIEIFSIRWNQLTKEEKNKLKTLVELKKNISTLIQAISLARKDFWNSIKNFKFGTKNENLNIKKWVRNDENDNMITPNKKNLQNLEMQKKTTIQLKKDTIDEEKK